MIQRKKHPKYRKPMSKENKNKMKKAIRLKEKQNLKEILYLLPLDLKKKIYYMSVQSNLSEWSFTHKYKFSNINLILQNNKNDDNGKWLRNENDDIFSYRHICSRNVKKREQPGILSIYIPPNHIYEEIDYRMWSNRENYYWVHKKCRCKMCDKIRLIYYKNNPNESFKNKYQNIEWPIWSDQWLSKSKNQANYEKNIQRNIQRNKIKIVKYISLENK